MAKMTPVSFPKELENDPRRNAEKKVFSALRDSLPDEFEVYYSRPWWGLDPDGSEKHGEADFIVGHPDKGVIFLEVKGGRVTYDPSNDRWQSTDRNGIGHHIKDPMHQAMTCMHKFLPLFKRDQIWPKRVVKMTYGTILPDTSTPATNKQVVGMHQKELFLFGSDFPEGLLDWLTGRLSKGESEIAPGAAGMQVIRRVVADPTKLSFPLRSVIEGEIAQMDQYLLGVQYQVLLTVLKNSRSVVLGGAGTGKTVVAVELCSRLADEGQSLLFLARNQNLLGYVSKMLPSEKIRVQSWPLFDSGPKNHSFDWVVVDEGQDLNHLELAELGRLSAGSNLAVFLDSNQAILNNPRQVSDRLGAEELVLSINLRNTKSISEVTGKLFEGDPPETIGPDGKEPTVEVVSGEVISATKAHVSQTLAEGIRKDQLTILTDTTALRDQILGSLNKSHVAAARYLEWRPDAIAIETMDDFKGLESDYLIVVVENPTALSKPMSYVAASRARSRLHLICSSADNVLAASIQGKSK